MAGFAGGIYLATRIVMPSRQPAADEGEQPTGVVWPQRTTLALGVSLLAHLCFLVIWFATSGRPGASATPVLLAVWALAMGIAYPHVSIGNANRVRGRIAISIA